MENQFSIQVDLETGCYNIKSVDGKTYTAGFDKEKVINLVKRLNTTHRPNVENRGAHELYVCWNNHDKNEACEFVKEI